MEWPTFHGSTSNRYTIALFGAMVIVAGVLAHLAGLTVAGIFIIIVACLI